MALCGNPTATAELYGSKGTMAVVHVQEQEETVVATAATVQAGTTVVAESMYRFACTGI